MRISMKSMMLVGLMASVSLWSAGAHADAEQFRIRCQSQGLDSYVTVRGNISAVDNGGFENARGVLTVSFGGSSYIRDNFLGKHVVVRDIEFLELRPMSNFSEIDDIYIDFRDNGIVEGSYVATRHEVIRMACRVE